MELRRYIAKYIKHVGRTKQTTRKYQVLRKQDLHCPQKRWIERVLHEREQHSVTALGSESFDLRDHNPVGPQEIRAFILRMSLFLEDPGTSLSNPWSEGF